MAYNNENANVYVTGNPAPVVGQPTYAVGQPTYAVGQPVACQAQFQPVYTNPHDNGSVLVVCDDDEGKALLGSEEDELIEMYITNQTVENRGAFVRKVMTLVACMLLFTFGTVVAGTLVANGASDSNGDPIKDSIRDITGAYMIPLVVMLICSSMITIMVPILMACCNIGRFYPGNYVMLTLYTLATSALFFWLSLIFTATSMYLAFGSGCAIAFGLMIYAAVTKRDFTGCGPYLFVVFFGLFVCCVSSGCSYYFLSGTTHAHLAPTWISAGVNALLIILYSLYIVYYTQLIVGGDHVRYQFSVDDYAFAALVLYAEIIEMILRILAASGDSR